VTAGESEAFGRRLHSIVRPDATVDADLEAIEAAVAGGAFDDIITLERLEAWLALGRDTVRVRANDDVAGRLGVAYALWV
jgi:hypothetical protein